MVANRQRSQKEDPEQGKGLQRVDTRECLEGSVTVQLKLELAFLLPHLIVLLTWLDFTIKSGVGENFVLGRSMVTHLLGQALHLTDGETEAGEGSLRPKSYAEKSF